MWPGMNLVSVICDSPELEAEHQRMAWYQYQSEAGISHAAMHDSPELEAEHQHLAWYDAGISHV